MLVFLPPQSAFGQSAVLCGIRVQVRFGPDRRNRAAVFKSYLAALSSGKLAAFRRPTVTIERYGCLEGIAETLAEDGVALTREQAAKCSRRFLPAMRRSRRSRHDGRDGDARRAGAGAGRLCGRPACPRHARSAHRRGARLAGRRGRHRWRRPLTFNISSGAALVAAAAGAKVAKHGNRAITSRCGAADVLEALGVPIELGPQKAASACAQPDSCSSLRRSTIPPCVWSAPCAAHLASAPSSISAPLSNPPKPAPKSLACSLLPRSCWSAARSSPRRKESLCRSRHRWNRRTHNHRRIGRRAR